MSTEFSGLRESPVSSSAAEAARSATVAKPADIFLMTNSFETGGSERQFVALANCLDSSAFRVHLGCVMRKGAFAEGLPDAPEFELGGNLYGLRSWKTRLRLSRHLRRNQIAIAHAFDFYTNLTLIPAARLARVPVVIGSQRQLGDLLTPGKFRAQMAALRWCDAVICNSHAAAKTLVGRGFPEHKAVVIGNGLPAAAFAETAPAFPRRTARVRVGMIARMNTPSKNHRLLLRAAARLRYNFADLEFLLAGDGPLRPELEREAQRLGVSDRVQFLGDVRDVPGFLASIDISVLPSTSESLSNAILESMAAGVPVVATHVGGNPELVTADRGVLVAPDDDQQLANALVVLISQPARRAACAENGRRFARENFTIDQMRVRHEELYKELLHQKTSRPSRSRLSLSTVNDHSRSLRVRLVAASLRYVGGQSAQADWLLRNWELEPSVDANLIPIDPVLPGFLSWIERVPGLRTIVREPFYVAALWQGLKDADVAHIFSASYSSFLIAAAQAWLMARLTGTPALIHYHSGEARDHLQRSRVARYILKKADRLVVPSGYLVDVFREFGLQAHVVPNVVELSQFFYRVRKPLRPHLLCSRGFHHYYSVDVVVRAFAEVQALYPEARLDLLGDGPTEHQIRELVRELKLKSVNFAGVVSREEIGRSYDAADIFVNASWLDNMPVSVLEAFASGTPVVSTAPEGMRYLVEHERTGLLSPPGDAHALAQNVVRLLREPELAAQLAASSYQECKRYRWEVVRDQWLDTYRSLNGKNGEAASELVGAAGASRQ
jgi:glycosyltransferase involved in cell wall biosynthesis